MPIDTSMYAAAVPKPYNPLDTVKTVTGINNAVQQNKLLQQNTANAQLENQRGQVGLSQEKFKLGMLHYDALQKIAAPVATNPNATYDDAVRALDLAKSNGLITEDQYNEEKPRIPQDSTGIHLWGVEHMIRAQESQKQLEIAAGTNTTVNNGNYQEQGVTAHPLFGGGFTGSTQTLNRLSPQDLAARVPTLINTPKGQAEGVTTMGSIVDDRANPLNQPEVSQNPAPSESPDQYTSDSNALDQRRSYEAANVLDPSIDNNNAPVERESPMKSLGGPVAIQTGFVPGEKEAKTIDSQASATQGTELQRAADEVADTRGILDNLDSLMEKGDFNTGPGAETWKKATSGLQRIFGIQSDGNASQEEFSKLSGQLSQRLYKAIGGTGTDDKLESAVMTSPNTALSTLGNKRIIALLRGGVDALATKNNEWQKYKEANGPESYSKFSATFNKDFDPRWFQIPYMDDKSKADLKKSMTKEQYQKFKTGFQQAGERGWLQ